MDFLRGRLKISAVMLFLLLVIGLACVNNLYAQLKKDEVDFEVVGTVVAEKGINCCLWNMAQKYYGDPLKWKCIQEMNKIPNERRISIGTVVYIPKKCEPKAAVAAVEPKVEPKIEPKEPSELDKLRAQLEDCQAKLKACEASKTSDEALKACKAENEKLSLLLDECRKSAKAGASDTKAQKKKIQDLKGELEECDAKLQRLTRAMKDKDATIDDLEAQLRKMRNALREREGEGLAEELKARERRIHELEIRLDECRRGGKGEMKEMKEKMGEKPPMPVHEKGECKSSRSFVAAMAIALVGSVVWIATSASD